MAHDHDSDADQTADDIVSSEKTFHDQNGAKPTGEKQNGFAKEDLASESTPAETTTDAESEPSSNFNKNWRFWAVMGTVTIGELLCSLESTVILTAMPTIARDIDLGSNYIWLSNAFFLTSAVPQPLFGQLCNIFGRKSVVTSTFAIYTLGSGLAGGATSAAMIIAGRAIQGLGSGGILAATNVVIGDLVPLRSRANYFALVLGIATIGYAIGPVVGGVIVENTTWRWVFYINIPFGALGMISTLLFLNLRRDRTESAWQRLKRIDYLGNAILIAASVSILIALTWAGPIYPWSDWHILVPFCIGLAGLVGFVFYEASSYPSEPVIPVDKLFPDRTAWIVFMNTFLFNSVTFWVLFFLPLYFQAVKLSTPTEAGYQILPTLLIAVPSAVASGIGLGKLGKFKMIHIIGFLALTAGLGDLAALQIDSSIAEWTCLQILPALAFGSVMDTLLPAFQATSEEKHQAVASGAWSFMRSFGYVWGVAIAGAIFNTYCKEYASWVDDAEARSYLTNGDAYGSATRAFVTSFDEPTRSQLQHVYMEALRKTFLVSTGFSGLALVASLFEKNIPLRTELETEYGLEEGRRDTSESSGV